MKKILVALIAALLLCPAAKGIPITDEALTHLGKPYVYATAGPNTFDCSGFTCYCYKVVEEVELKRSARDQGYDDSYEKIESAESLIPGDLVFFNTNQSDLDKSDHAGMYLGNGEFIHCSSSKGKVVISSLLEGFYNEHFSWGRRVITQTTKTYPHRR